MRTIALAGVAASLFAAAPARAASRYQCGGDAAYRRALAVRSVVRDYDDAEDAWRDDVDRSMSLAHGSTWRAGVAGEGGFDSIPALPCDAVEFPGGVQALYSIVDRYGAAFFDTHRQIEIDAFRLDSTDALRTSIPNRVGPDFVIDSGTRTLSLTGLAVRTEYVSALAAFEDREGGWAEIGSPALGVSFDLLLPKHTAPDYRARADDVYESGVFALSASGEDRAAEHLVFIEPRVGIATREGESHAGGYAATAIAMFPGGVQSSRLGLEFDGRGLSPTDGDPVMQAHLRAWIEGTIFDLARASHPAGAGAPHSFVGGFASGIGVILGGSVMSYGFDVRGGVNRPELLRDLPSAHGHGDVALMMSMRITPPVPH